jgi:hypothetical protein
MRTDRILRLQALAILVLGAIVVVAASSPLASGQEEAAALSHYNTLRAKVRPTADSHWRLAQWCAEHGLKAEAEIHYGEVVRLDPKREAAWRKLGFKKINGRWMNDSQIAAEKAQRDANKIWGPRLQNLHDAVHDQKTRADAVAELARVEEPAAIPSVWNVFGRGGAGDQLIAVQLLGQIRAPASSQLLAILAVFAPSTTVRGRAAETLRDRDPDDYALGLIDLIREPLRYLVWPIMGPGSTGGLLVEGEEVYDRRFYIAPAPQMKESWGTMPSDGQILNVYTQHASKSPVALLASQMVTQAAWQENQLEAARAAASLHEQMASDIALIEWLNTLIRDNNARISMLLRTTMTASAGKAPPAGDDRASWRSWLETRKGRSPTRTPPSRRGPKPIIDEFVPLNYVPAFVNVLHHTT